MFLQRSVDSGFVIRYSRRMKRLIIIAALCIIPVSSYSHPGKTDWRGGHKCIKGCEEWGLFYAEYHLHDKDWKPIRLGRKKHAPETNEPVKIQTAATETVLPAPLVTSNTKTITVYRYVANVPEEDIFSYDPLLSVFLILLLLLLILRVNRRREKN